MSGFELDRHLEDLKISRKAQEELNNARRLEKEEKERRLRDRQKEVALAVLNDLIDRTNLRGLMEELNNRLFQTRGKIEEVVDYTPFSISSNSFRIECGPLISMTTENPPKSSIELTLRDPDKKRAKDILCMIVCRLGKRDLYGNASMFLGRNPNFPWFKEKDTHRLFNAVYTGESGEIKLLSMCQRHLYNCTGVKDSIHDNGLMIDPANLKSIIGRKAAEFIEGIS